MTSPARAPASLAPLLARVDESMARSIMAEGQLLAEVDAIYAKYLASYYIVQRSTETEEEQEEEETHPLLTAALLAAMVVLLRRSFRDGSSEGLKFGQGVVSDLGLVLDPSSVTLQTRFADAVIRDFLSGQVDLATKSREATAETLASALAQRARAGVLVGFHGGRNETTEAVFSAAAAQWTGEVHKMWVARFGLETPPCAMCIRLHGMHVSLDSDFPVSEGEPTPYLGALARPPRHPQCVIGSTRVSVPGVVPRQESRRFADSLVSVGSDASGCPSRVSTPALTESYLDVVRSNVRAVTDREYVGDVVTVEVALGYSLTATSNHPIATDRGWVAISELCEGDNVLCSTNREWTDIRDPDVDNIPPTVEEVAQSVSVAFESVPTPPEAFHGDGSGSKVHVVRSDSFLRYNVDYTEVFQHDLQAQFVPRGVRSRSFNAQSVPTSFREVSGSPSNGDVRCLRELGALFGACAAHAEEVGRAAVSRLNVSTEEKSSDQRSGDVQVLTKSQFALSSDIPLAETVNVDRGSFGTQRDPVSYEVVSYGGDADAEIIRKLTDARPCQVAFSQVVSIKRECLSTHVYNLESSEGWFAANGIITHNCRCSLILYLPSTVDVESGPTPLAMMQYAEQVLCLADSQFDTRFVAASVVKVEPYTRVVNGRTEHVDGYYYDVARGVKVVAPPASAKKTQKVSLHRAKALAQDAQRKKRPGTSGGKSAPSRPGGTPPKFSVGTYHINLPDGSVTEVTVHSDGSSKSVADGRTENADPDQTQRFLEHWQASLEQIDSSDAGLDDVEHPEFSIGGVSVNADLVKDAIQILKNESSTSVKAPLKAADHPLASANLRQFADERSGGKLHYSKLKQGVIDALQSTLKGETKKGSGEESTKEETPSPAEQRSAASEASPEQKSTGSSVESAASVARPSGGTPVVPATDLREWRNVLDTTRMAFKVAPVAGDQGSGLAAALQKVASTRHRYYVHVDEVDTKVSMKELPLTDSGVHFVVNSNGSVWERVLGAGGSEQLRPMPVADVRELVNGHLQSTGNMTLDRAAVAPRAVKDDQLDSLMQDALSLDRIDVFESLAVEADRRDAKQRRDTARNEARAVELEKLLQSGKNEEDAIEEVYGVSGENQRRKAAIAALRADGYSGVNLTELARKAFRDDIYRRYIDAENSMQGHMLSKEGEAKGISPLALFSGREAVAMKYASPELVDWWEIHGRPSYEEWIREFLAQFGSDRNFGVQVPSE